jgi:hypothetical protein
MVMRRISTRWVASGDGRGWSMTTTRESGVSVWEELMAARMP